MTIIVRQVAWSLIITGNLKARAEKFRMSDRVEIACLGRHSLYKDKAVPLQAWSGPEGSRKLRFPDFMTTAQNGGKVVSLMHRPPLLPGNTPGTHFC